MIQICGSNNFVSGTFDENDWSAPIYQSTEEVRSILTNLMIAGRTIKSVYSVGPGYNYSKEWLDNYALAANMKEKPEKEYFPPITECIPDSHIFSRIVLIDKPIIIGFDTGDQLELEFNSISEIRISMNTLPSGIESNHQFHNIDLNTLFSEIIGTKIVGIQIGRRNDIPQDWKQPRGEEWKQQDSLVAYVLFQTDGIAGLALEPYKETGRAMLICRDRKIRPIPFGDLKRGLTIMPFGEEGLEPNQ